MLRVLVAASALASLATYALATSSVVAPGGESGIYSAGTSKSCAECRQKHGDKAGQRCMNVCKGQ